MLDAVARIAHGVPNSVGAAAVRFRDRPGQRASRRARWRSGCALPGRFRARSGKLRTTDHFAGFQITGTLSDRNLIATLERLPEGLTEFMCHPGKLGPELRAAKPD